MVRYSACVKTEFISLIKKTSCSYHLSIFNESYSEEEDFSSDEKSPRIADSDSLYSVPDWIKLEQLESLQWPEVAGLGRGPRHQPPLVQHLLRPRADIADREVVRGDEPAEEILLRGERALCDRTRSENTLRLSSCFQYGCSMVQRERVLSSGGMSVCSKHGSAFVD